MKRAVAVLATVLVSAVTVTAQAETFKFKSDFGPVTLTVDPSGSVSGYYPSYNGKIVAHVTEDGSMIRGVWVQPTSEQRCAQPSNGSYYWGELYFTSPSRHGRITGKWSYCDNAPNQPWNGSLN